MEFDCDSLYCAAFLSDRHSCLSMKTCQEQRNKNCCSGSRRCVLRDGQECLS